LKTIIIPDIHNKFSVVEEILLKEKDYDKVVFLGDYFDSFGDEHDIELVSKTAEWLQYSTKITNRIHLFGNHDLWYSCGDDEIKCAGNTEFKRFIIKQKFTNWSVLKFHAWVDGWLCTHAGLSAKISLDKSVESIMQEIEKEGKNHPLVRLCGEARGGIEGEVGGILWCDYSESYPVSNLKQIFGHTKDNKVRKYCNANGINICLDTGLKHYAIIKNEKITIKRNV
jgi:hypothetical protein